MQDTTITKDRLRTHFTYGLWKYILLAVLTIFGWNLIYSMTAYRAPDDKRLDAFFVTYSVPEEVTQTLRQAMLDLSPHLEDASCNSIVYTPENDYYGTMQFSTYISAGEGDVYILTLDNFDRYKETGVFLDLGPAILSGDLNLRGMDSARGKAITEYGDEGIFGIPATELYGMMDMGLDNRDLVMCVMAYSQTQQEGIAFINWLIGETMAQKPDGLIAQEMEAGSPSGLESMEDIPSY